MESGDIPGAGRWFSSSTAPAKERSAQPLETLKRGTEVKSHSYRSGQETLALYQISTTWEIQWRKVKKMQLLWLVQKKLYQISTTWEAGRRTTTTNSQETRAPAPAGHSIVVRDMSWKYTVEKSFWSIHLCARHKGASTVVVVRLLKTATRDPTKCDLPFKSEEGLKIHMEDKQMVNP